MDCREQLLTFDEGAR